MSTIVKYAFAWGGLVLLAVLNGVLRERAYGPLMDALTAHQLSTALGLLLFTGYIWCLTGIWKILSRQQALAIGAVWLVLTVTFEFLFGHYVMGHPWQTLFADYNILKGRLWSLVVVWTALSPYVFFRIRA